MTIITGRFVDSGGVVLTSGYLEITLDTFLVDVATTPDTLYLSAPARFTITNGLPTTAINVVQSATANTTYRFGLYITEQSIEFYLPGGVLYSGPFHQHTDGFWYTDSTHNTESVVLSRLVVDVPALLQSFRAVVPNVATVEFTSLIPTGISTDKLPTTVARIAELLVSDATFVTALRGGPRFKGEYVATTYYQQDDSVGYGGSSWVFINRDPAVGQTPSVTNTAYWQLLAQKGDAGGTGGNNTAYDSTGWDGATDAPSRNAVRDVVELLARANSPALTGNPTAPTQLTTDDSTRLANTAYSNALITTKLNNTQLTGTPTRSANPLTPDSTTQLATTAFVKAAIARASRIIGSRPAGTAGGASVVGIQTRTLNTITANSGDVVSLTGNVFTLRGGTYSIRASAPCSRGSRHRIFLWNVTAGARMNNLNGVAINGTSEFAGAVDVVTRSFVFDVFTIAANTDFELRHYIATAQANNGLGVETSDGTNPEIYAVVEIIRID